MMRLPLHWQIIIGMLAGSIIGITLNLGFSKRSVTVTEAEQLPVGISRVEIQDSSDTTTVSYWTDGDEPKSYTLSPAARGPDAIRSLADLEQSDPIAARLYLKHGQSTAKTIGGWFKRIGGLFLRMLQMVAVLLIVTSLMSGIMGIAGERGVGRLFRRTIAYYLTTSFLAIMTGLVIVNTIRPGLKDDAPAVRRGGAIEAKPLGDVLFEQLEAMIPRNPLAALTEPNYLSVIAFTIAFALFAASVGGATAERVATFASDGFAVMMAMTSAIISLAPFGVFFLMANVTATQGIEIFRFLGWYVLSVALALLFHAAVTLPLILKFFAHRSPGTFVRNMSPALLTAFSSASSNGTLPITMSSAENRAGISNRTASFVLPLGATVNMDGTALYEVVAVLFIAQMHYGVNLELSQQIVVVVTALLASIGAAGVPHAGLVMMSIILFAVGLPLEMQGVILAVDRVLDMGRTSVNVWSDSCGCAVVEAHEPQPGAA